MSYFDLTKKRSFTSLPVSSLRIKLESFYVRAIQETKKLIIVAITNAIMYPLTSVDIADSKLEFFYE